MSVGIDVGIEINYVGVFDWRNYEYTKKLLVFSNTETGFQTFRVWMEDGAEKHSKTVAIPGIESASHYWFALRKLV